MKTAVALLTIVLSASTLSAQPNFERTYGGTGTDYCYGARQTLDGGYLVYGYTTSYGPATGSAWLIKTDEHGDTLWTRTHGASGVNCATAVLLKPDSGYVVGGYTSSIGAGRNDFMLLETDASGDTLWLRAYGGGEDDQAYALTQTGDGGYLLAGQTESYGAGDKDIWLVRTDADGDTLWTRTYGDSGWDGASAVAQTPDGGFAISGFLGGTDEDDAWLIRIDADGDTLWTRTFGGDERSDYGSGLVTTGDHGFVFTGRSHTYGGPFGDLWLVRTDSLGDSLWIRSYGGSDVDAGQSVCVTTDGGFAVAGGTKSFGSGDYDVWLLRLDSLGDTLWTRTFGGSQIEYGVTVEQTPDGGFVIGGYTAPPSGAGHDFYLIKTDPDGYVAVVEPDRPSVRLATPGATVISRARLPAEMTRSGFELFDVAGRPVKNVVGVSPGVYFLGRGTTGKLVVTR